MKNTEITKKTTRGTALASILVEDQPKIIDNCQVFKSSANGRIYIYNQATKKAGAYEADGTGYKPISAPVFNKEITALKTRIEARKIAEWRAAHGEDAAQTGRSKETNAVEPDAYPTMDSIPIRREERWIGTDEKQPIWPLGSFVTVRMQEKEGSRKEDGRIDPDAYYVEEDNAYEFTFEEVRSENGKPIKTGKTVQFFLKADQKTVDSFKSAINRRYNNYIWEKLNEGVTSKWAYKKVKTVDLSVFFEYLVKFPIKILYDHTEWVDQTTGQSRRSAKPKVRLWLPGDFDNDNREYHNTKATC